MKIAIVNNFFYPRVGGSSIIAEQLANGFTKKGHEVMVVTASYGGAPEMELMNGFIIRRVRAWTLPKSRLSLNFDINFALIPGNSRQVSQILHEFQPDVIHCHGQFLDLTWKALKFGKKNSIPCILTLHTRLVNPNFFLNLLLKSLDRAVVFPILKRFPPQRVVIIDKEFSKYAIERYPLSQKSFSYISVGIELEKFIGLKYVPMISKSERIIILSVGHVIPVRNRVTLFEALPSIIKLFPKVHVRVIGSVYHDECIKIAEKLSLLDHISFVGAIPSSQVSKELEVATLEIHDVQGFGVGIASLEAMAAGVPTVMAVDTEYFPHAILIPDSHFIQSEPNDPISLSNAVLKALCDRDLLERVSVRAREYVKNNFDIKVVVDAHLDLFHETLESK